VLLVEDDETETTSGDGSRELGGVALSGGGGSQREGGAGPPERSERIDILFSDVVMPGGMNGAQLAVEARRLRPELQGATHLRVRRRARGGKSLTPRFLFKQAVRRDELARTLRLVLGSESA
jgi:DNA-binding LytR/AlgR family response regulator